ncbi:dipeptidase [Laedolimicola sp.]|uniref:dipeptidase n=1 Tax=Laedolimicola sp. TaxID=2981663 RepID=UPI003F8134FF
MKKVRGINMFIQEQYLELARKIHRENPVVDAHFDLAAEVYERRLTGESGVVEQRYLPHFQEAGLNILVSSIYLTNRDLPELGLRKALGQITALKEDIEPVGDRIRVTKSRAELEENLAAGRISVLLSLEGLDPLGNDLSLLRTFYDLGVRGAGLTWSRRNAFATGCCTAGQFKEIPGGLTELGKEAIRRMERLGMWLDVSHLSNEGFRDVCDLAEQPFIASHSDAWAVHENYRNLTDDQIREIAGRGGVIGLNACGYLTGVMSEREKTEREGAAGAPEAAGQNADVALLRLCEHAEHLVRIADPEHVGYGFDLCKGLEETTPRIRFETENYDILAHHGEMGKLTALLLQRGMDEATAKGIAGGNFLRYYCRILK